MMLSLSILHGNNLSVDAMSGLMPTKSSYQLHALDYKHVQIYTVLISCKTLSQKKLNFVKLQKRFHGNAD